MDHLVDRLDVRGDVVMREHHALGHAGGAGGEDDRGHVVAADAVQAEHAIEQQCRARRYAPRTPASLSPRVHFVAQVFEVDELGVERVFELRHHRVFHHLAAGEDVADAGPAQAGVEHFRRGGVVEIGGDAAGHREGGVGDHAADRRRQQEADVFFIGVEHVAQQQPAHDERARPAVCRR